MSSLHRWRIRVAVPWRDVPSRNGSWSAVYALFRRWQRDGTWRSSSRCRLSPTRPGGSPGMSPWTPPAPAPISMRPGRGKGGSAGRSTRRRQRRARRPRPRPGSAVTARSSFCDPRPSAHCWPPQDPPGPGLADKAYSRTICWRSCANAS
nr:transposase [Micromonospora sp. KC207]